jgi:two-component system alkaline phosphatase synthesis response regulator PhoP
VIKALILIAERDQSVRALERHFLEHAGFEVAFADHGLELLERVQVARPSVIITEILIPKLDGLTLCRRLHDDPSTRDIPVIVFSILSAAPRAAEAGAFAFLRKPLVESVFVGIIHEAIAAQPTHEKEQ